MNREQKIVALGAGSGVATMVVSVAVLTAALPAPTDLPDAGARLAYALRADLFAALPLLAGVVAVGNDRFLSDAIDPTRHAESKATDINGRVVENTLQQLVIFLIATLAIAASLPAERLQIVPAATIVFVAVRVAFWVGYRIDPLYRAFGMAATMYLNIGLLAYAAWGAAQLRP